MAFQEFYCNSAGSNLAGGSGTGAVTATYTSSVAPGAGWNAATGVFEVASGNPLTDGVAVGEYASVYVTVGATVAVFSGRVTARDATTITISLTSKSGTAPATDTAGATTCKVGGAWSGPAAAVNFPFGFVAATAIGASAAIPPRVNLNGTFSVSAGIVHAPNGPVTFQGYTSTAGDGGRATIQGGGNNVGNNYALLTINGHFVALVDVTLKSTYDRGYVSAGVRCVVRRCVATDFGLTGFAFNNTAFLAEACEAYGINTRNTANYSGFAVGATGGSLVRCIAHDNVGSNGRGFYGAANTAIIGCIAESNGECGFLLYNAALMLNCDAYNNGSDGLRLPPYQAEQFQIENCNFVKNGGWGINQSGTTGILGEIRNCAFGAGTQVNTSGAVSSALYGMEEFGRVTLDANVTPWVDPANGDFRINRTTVIGAGYGTFLQTAPSYAGAVSAPVIGACQVADYPAAANVATGSGTYANGAYTPGYPTTATTQAADAATLTGATLDADGTDTDVAFGASTGVAGTAAVYAAGEAAQKVTDAAFLETNKDEIIQDDADILAEFGVTGTAKTGGRKLIGALRGA